MSEVGTIYIVFHTYCKANNIGVCYLSWLIWRNYIAAKLSSFTVYPTKNIHCDIVLDSCRLTGSTRQELSNI